MVDNIEKVLERGEKIELLVDKTDNLRFQVISRVVCLASVGLWCSMGGTSYGKRSRHQGLVAPDRRCCDVA